MDFQCWLQPCGQKNTFSLFHAQKGDKCAQIGSELGQMGILSITRVGVAFTVPFVARVNRGT